MSKESTVRGVSAAPGVVYGKAVVLDRVGARDARIIPASDRAAEPARARHALEVVGA